MNRWYVETLYTQGKEPMKIYGNTIEDVQKSFPEATSITPCEDRSHLPYIKKMIERSDFLDSCTNEENNQITELYRYKGDGFDLYIKLYKYSGDGEYYDYAETQSRTHRAGCVPITWNVCYPEEVYDMYFTSDFRIERVAYRQYGQSKLAKPKELKAKQTFSIEWERKCKFPVHIQGNDVWVKHRDYFSKSFRPPDNEIGRPMNFYLEKYFNTRKNEKFIYADNWGEIILRDEAWVKYQDLILLLRQEEKPLIGTPHYLVEQLIKSDDVARNALFGYISYQQMYERLFEQLIKGCLNWMRSGQITEKEENKNVQ